MPRWPSPVMQCWMHHQLTRSRSLNPGKRRSRCPNMPGASDSWIMESESHQGDSCTDKTNHSHSVWCLCKCLDFYIDVASIQMLIRGVATDTLCYWVLNYGGVDPSTWALICCVGETWEVDSNKPIDLRLILLKVSDPSLQYCPCACSVSYTMRLQQ